MPQSLYVDNGSRYAGKDLTVVCARLGCLRGHTPVRDGAAKGKVDAIILTGGIAYGKEVVHGITEMCGFIAPVIAYPGEGELEALALAGMRALSGEAKVQNY